MSVIGESLLCEGVAALHARRQPWQDRLLEEPEEVADLLEEWGSPLNVIDPGPVVQNLAELQGAADRHDVPLRCFFARKANKSLALVDRALELGAGVDVASEAELLESLERGAAGSDLVVTAAIKSRGLFELCARESAACVIDNADELDLACEAAGATDGRPLPVGFRLALTAGRDGAVPTRFGLGAAEILELVRREWGRDGAAAGHMRVDGIHFHVDGYDAADRARGLRSALWLFDALAAEGHALRWIDIGGGVPMRYLSDPRDWSRFWSEHREALCGRGAPVTYGGHGLGLRVEAGRCVGSAAVYPAAQPLVRGPWLEAILYSPAGDGSGGDIASALRRRGVELRCEPGRALLDGCGMTLARVAFRKRGAAGDALVGLEMNRTQLRTTADDSMIDPVMLRPPGAGEPSAPLEGFLVGAYCVERELISWRRFRFPQGVAVGDVLAFPNTAGYFMHILESRSHGLPLARNLVPDEDGGFAPDPIDERQATLLVPGL